MIFNYSEFSDDDLKIKRVAMTLDELYVLLRGIKHDPNSHSLALALEFDLKEVIGVTCLKEITDAQWATIETLVAAHDERLAAKGISK